MINFNLYLILIEIMMIIKNEMYVFFLKNIFEICIYLIIYIVI